MLSINTNLQSLIVQNNLTKSTTGLNQAIERMTTGFKINHASDNAANYSISENMSSQLSSYEVAQDNVAMGMDLISTAQDTITLMQNKGERLMVLWTQAQNGTYGAQSLSAMNSEAEALIKEINRTYKNTEYNGISLLSRNIVLTDGLKEAGESGFIDESEGTWGGTTPGSVKAQYNGFIADGHTRDDAEVNALQHVSELSNFVLGSTYAVSSVEDLAKLAELVSSGKDSTNVTFVMGADIDLTAWCEAHSGTGGWNPIGNSSAQFKGTFDGNGHKISGVKINRANNDYQSVFGYATGELKNVGVENVDIKGKQFTGGLAGRAYGTISNCYVTGSVSGAGNGAGGLVGAAYAISNSYSTGSVNNTGGYTGGLAGSVSGTISNCYSTGSVKGTGINTGGLVGWAGTISNCKASGSVSGGSNTGGLAGYAADTINNSYATGSVSGTGEYVGGLAGFTETITNCYAAGSVSGTENFIGGLAGWASNTISNSYATGSVSGARLCTGGLTGRASNTIITNSYATGTVTGTSWAGGIAGYISKTSDTLTWTNVVSYSLVKGTDKVGSLVGGVISTSDGSSFGEITFTDCKSAEQGIAAVGFEGNPSGTVEYRHGIDTWLEDIKSFGCDFGIRSLQVGINGNDYDSINVNTNLNFNLNSILTNGIESQSSYNVINDFLNALSTRATEFGAVSNRLESSLESISVSIDNLASSRSTLRDADIAQESSQYIKNQILQQAAATLLATANQSPSIALNLL